MGEISEAAARAAERSTMLSVAPELSPPGVAYAPGGPPGMGPRLSPGSIGYQRGFGGRVKGDKPTADDRLAAAHAFLTEHGDHPNLSETQKAAVRMHAKALSEVVEERQAAGAN